MLNVMLVALAIRIVAGAGPAPLPVLTLDEALELALANNLDLANARLETDKSEAAMRAARTRLMPALDVTAIGSKLLTPVDFRFPEGAFGTFPGIGPVPAEDTVIRSDPGFNTFLNASVTQPLSQLYRAGLGVRLEETGHRLDLEKLRGGRIEVAAGVKRLYHAILAARDRHSAAGESVTALRELERIAERRVANEGVLEADLLDVRARRAAQEYDELAAGHTLSGLKEQLNDVLGRDIMTPFDVTPLPEATPLETDTGEAHRLALDRRPEIREARLQVEQADYNRRIRRAEFIPGLSVGYNYYANLDVDVLPARFSAFRLMFTWEPFDWGRRRNEVAEAARSADQAAHALKQAQARVLLDVNDRMRKLVEARAMVEVSRLGAVAAKEHARVAANRYRNDAALLQDVLEAQARLADALSRATEANLAVWTARAEFERSIGQEPGER